MRDLRRVWVLFLSLFLLTGPALAQGDPEKAAGEKPADKAAGGDHGKKKAADEDAEEEVHHDGPVKMTFGLDVLNLGKLDIATGSYTAEFQLTIDCDHPCKPDFDIVNGKISGKPEKTDDTPTHKEYRVKAELNGEIDLSEFPFDEHYLPIIIAEKGDTKGVSFAVAKKDPGIDDDVKLAGWEILASVNEVEKEKLSDGEEIPLFHYGIGIHRPRTASFFKAMMPACFMILVALLGLLLKPKSAPARLTAATAALMTVVMFHISSTASLPPVAYLTRMDKFMIATYFVYLVNIGFAIAMVRFEEAKNEKASNLAYLVAGGAVPGLALILYMLVFLRIV